MLTHEHDRCSGTEQHRDLCTPQQWLVLSSSVLSKTDINYIIDMKRKKHKCHCYYIEICDCEFDEPIVLTLAAFPFAFQFFYHEKDRGNHT